jgi:8-amino-7-oxononanoate synthase
MSSSPARKQDTTDQILAGRMQLTSEGHRDAFHRAYQFKEVGILREMGIYPFHLTIDSNQGPIAIVDGSEIIMLGSNNYLGLTIHPEVRQAAMNAIAEYGTSMTGSRLLNGTHRLLIELEEKLAAFLNKPACLVFTTGYQVNLGILSSFFKKGTALILDEPVHASIHDGSRLGNGEKHFFKHNDMQDLEKLMVTASPGTAKIIMVDGVYSMEGDIAPLDQICAVAARHQARVILDDAHGIGMLGGSGQGSAAHFGVTDQIDLMAGTFSKTLASVGGFVAGEASVIDYIKHWGRPMLFSASLPPASAAAAIKSLEIMQREPERVHRLNDNAAYMRKSLRQLGFDIGASETAIIPIVVGDEIKCLTIWKELLDMGVYTNAVLYPAVPQDRSILRTSYTSEHSREHLDKALDIFSQLKQKHSW